METNERLQLKSVFIFLRFHFLNVFLCLLTIYYGFGMGHGIDDIDLNEPIGLRYLYLLLSFVFYKIYIDSFSRYFNGNELQHTPAIHIDDEVSIREHVNRWFNVISGVTFLFMFFFPIGLLFGSIYYLTIGWGNEVFSPLFYLDNEFQWDNLDTEKERLKISSFYFSVFYFTVFVISIPYAIKQLNFINGNGGVDEKCI